MTHLFRQRRSLRALTLYFSVIAIACLLLSDIAITTRNPEQELWKMAVGLVTPQLPGWRIWLDATLYTLTFALQGVAIATAVGFIFSLYYQYRWVRTLAAVLRSVHEVFWALLFIQIFGLTTLTGVLAIAVPFSGALAKVFGEQLDDVNPTPRLAIYSTNKTNLSVFLFTQLPQAFQGMATYTAYRMECAIRSSVVLGFIGLPTLGFYLETALRTGEYSLASGMLLTLLALLYSLRFWLKKKLLLGLIPISFFIKPVSGGFELARLSQFLADCIPAPLRNDWGTEKTIRWLAWLGEQAATGTWNTLLLAQSVLVLTGLFAITSSTLNSSHFVAGKTRQLGDGLLLILRSIPEYLLNFLFLILLGPSMLPAIIALTLHNGAIIGHLLGKQSDAVEPDAMPSNGLSRFSFFYIPKMAQRFLAYCFYRWEIIIRETAMLGVLGIPTLGFYIDSAFEFLRFDVAVLLIALSSVLTISADQLSTVLRQRFRIAG